MSIIHVVACTVVANKELLVVRKRNTLKFMLPGGKIDAGENDLDCLAREVMEELGCQLELENLSFLGKFTASAANEANTLVTARIYSGQFLGTPVPFNEIEELRWISRDSSEATLLAPLLADWVLPRLLELACL